MKRPAFSREALKLDAARACVGIEAAIRDQVIQKLRRRGAVVGLSGGIDSSVVAALCARALGPDRVLGLFMPEADTSSETTGLGLSVAQSLGIGSVLEDISRVLESAGCYKRRDDAIRTVLPEYGNGYKSKIVRPGLSERRGYSVFWLVAEDPQGKEIRVRLTGEAYLGIVAATNFKQRTRKMLEYYHADRMHYAVAGTPNRLEYDQGFFVKNGDGAADFKPIAHLYKTQVYQLAEYVGIPEDIRNRPPTTDTYSLPQSQDEFYFFLPHGQLDLCLYGWNHGIPAAEVAPVAELSESQVDWVYRDIEAKRQATRYLHSKPLLIEDMPEVGI
jgi:NAD+ synthase